MKSTVLNTVLMRISEGDMSIISFIILMVLAIFPLIVPSSFILSILITVALFAFAGEAWNILAGYCGQWSLGHALFFAIGGYGLVAAQYAFNVNPLLGVFLGIIFNIPCALFISGLSLKLGGLYFSMASITVPTIVQFMIAHYTHVVIGGVVVGGWWGWPIKPPPLKPIHYYYILLLLVGASMIFVKGLERSKLGYFMKAVRDNERLAMSLGINTYKIKTIAMIISAMITSIAGSIYCLYGRFVSPQSLFDFVISLNIMIGASLAGLGTSWGPLVGSLIVFPAFALIRGYIGGRMAGMTQVLGGVLLIIAYLVRMRMLARMRVSKAKPSTE